MPTDEWLDRWLNAQIHEIEKVSACGDAHYTELSKSLRDLELELIQLASAVQEIRATIDELSNDQTASSVQFTDMIRKNSDDILKHSAVCPHPADWKRVWDRLTALETTILTIRHEFDVKNMESNHKQDLDIKELMVNARNTGMVAGGGIGTVCGAIVTIITNVLMNKP